jgi:hypothetical protein
VWAIIDHDPTGAETPVEDERRLGADRQLSVSKDECVRPSLEHLRVPMVSFHWSGEPMRTTSA